MTTITRRAAVVTAALALFALAGCASTPAAQHQAASTQHEPAFRAAPCNLGARLDYDVIRAKYSAPEVDASLLTEYGPMIANDSCSDADIIRWQELRRAQGESDRICRVVYYDDYTSATVYPIGCAVPTLVSADATR